MEKLPEALLIDILSRVDSANVARCRVASKIFDNVYPQLRCINLKCTLKPSINSRCRLSIPFKKVFLNLISNMEVVESVCIGIDELRGVSENLKSLSITDFWEQSLWGLRSNALQLVSAYYHKLVKLKVKHAWLSADRLNPMPMLTSVTFISVILDDDGLTELNKCTPNLQDLSLVDVIGSKHIFGMICKYMCFSPLNVQLSTLNSATKFP
ncbi:F-box/LRR-repeat protein [Tanacetum coccineum]